MSHPNLPPGEQPDHFAEIAAGLRLAATRVEALVGSGLPKPNQIELNIQPGGRGNDELTVKAVDAWSFALFGHPGQIAEMSGGVYHYNSGDWAERIGAVKATVYQSVSNKWVEAALPARQLVEREAELEKLRAEVAELRAAQSGFGYSREADDPTPVSPARMPLQTGGVVDGGQLVDETATELRCYVPNGFQAPEVIAAYEAACAARHPERECRR